MRLWKEVCIIAFAVFKCSRADVIARRALFPTKQPPALCEDFFGHNDMRKVS